MKTSDAMRLTVLASIAIAILATSCGKKHPTRQQEEVVISAVAVNVGGEDSPFAYQSTQDNQTALSVTGAAPPVQVNDILVNTQEPYFLRKVTQVVRQTSTEVVVETTPAALTEVIQSASIHEHFTIDAGSPKAVGPSRTQELTFTADLSGKVIASADGIELQTTSGHVTYKPAFDFDMKIDQWQLQEFRLAASGNLDAELGLQLTARRAFSRDYRQTFAQIPPTPYYVVFWVGFVPVLVGVQIEVIAGADVDVAGEATATIGFALAHEALIGVQYVDGHWQEIKEGTPEFSVQAPELQTTASAAFRGFVAAQLNAELYNVAGPHLGLEPYTELAVALSTPPDRLDWEVAAGVDAYVGAHVEVLDHTLADYSKSFEWWRAVLKRGEALPQTPGTTPPQEPGDTPPTGTTRTFDLPGGATMDFVWIEPGTFVMGSPESDDCARENEKPQHRVTITRGFWLGKYEVTQGQWQAVMWVDAKLWHRRWGMLWEDSDYVRVGPDYPAAYISWDNVQEFIEELNQYAGRAVYRLPTEAEWEYACRAGTTTRWPFGDGEECGHPTWEGCRLGDYAWYVYNTCHLQDTWCYAHAVGTKLPNPWGLHDMCGNVWELVQDWYGTYPREPQTDPTGPSSGSLRVLRGDAFGIFTGIPRPASRRSSEESNRYWGSGARLLRTE